MKKNILVGLIKFLQISFLCLCFSLFGNTAYSIDIDQEDYRLYVLDCGRIFNGSTFIHTGQIRDMFKATHKINTCFLIKKGDVEFLWDAGIPDWYLNKYPKGKKKLFGLFKFTVINTLESQLNELGIDVLDIDYIGLSHMHMDHSGNMELFKNAKILIQKEEFKAAFSKERKKHHFEYQLYDDIPKKNFIQLDGDYDVFNDKKVVIKKAPGHTPGHQILSLVLKNEGRVVLSGDIYSTKKTRRLQAIPLFNSDKEKSKKTMQELEKYLKRTNAKLWIQHDLEQFLYEVRMSPYFYSL